MSSFINFCKNWGGVCLVGVLCLVLLSLFAASEYTCDSPFVRIIYGIPTMIPIGVAIPYFIKKINKEE